MARVLVGLGTPTTSAPCPASTKGDTLQAAKYIPARGMPMTHSNEEPAPRDDGGSWFAAIFFGLTIAAAILFTLYVLLWDGGANT
jgi:hypothetical protein